VYGNLSTNTNREVIKERQKLFLTKYHAKKTYGRAEVQRHSSTSVLDGGEWLASLSGRFTPREKVPIYLPDRKMVGARRDVINRRNFLYRNILY
jgi:hypothetical protein